MSTQAHRARASAEAIATRGVFRMKTKLQAGVFAALSLATLGATAMADDKPWGPFTAGVALTSDYRFRGISQSDRDGAVQGFVQVDFFDSFYFNVWASSIDFND